MKTDFVSSVTASGTQVLQRFNQNTLHLCHNMLRHLPKSKSAFQDIHITTDIDRVKEIESFLLDQTEKLMSMSDLNNIKKDYGIEMPELIKRSDTEKRFVALLNHFIKYSERHNPSVFNTLSVKYPDDTVGNWNKDKIDKVGGQLKGTNPMKLYRFIKAVANSADPDSELNFESPVLKKPSKELELGKESNELLMTLVKNGSIDLDDDLTEEEFSALVAEIVEYADALKYKENSIQLRQETLMSIFQGNPNGTVKELILGTNAMSMELKNEQMVLSGIVESLTDFAMAHNFTSSVEAMLDKINDKMKTYTLQKDDNLNFIIRSEELDTIMIGQPENEFELASGIKT